MTVMTNESAPERAAALVNAAIDVLQRAAQAPASPVNTFQPAQGRRQLRRDAARLRLGKAQPRYRNLHSAEQLADIYERTARRDQIFEQALRDFKRIVQDLDRLLEENDPEVEKRLAMFFREAMRSAEEHGPGSEAAQRYRQLEFLGWIGLRYRSHKRRGRFPVGPIPMAPDPLVEVRCEATAAEILASPPSSGESVIAIPPDGKDSGRGRIFLRIGLREASWIGSFERGHKRVSTVGMLPDLENLFVCAGGAGYIIDAKSRTLVEQIGTEIVGLWRDELLTTLVVNHNDMSLEAFGKSGRLWKTPTISAGGFREVDLIDDKIVGQARHPLRQAWTGFEVNLATGDVRYVE